MIESITIGKGILIKMKPWHFAYLVHSINNNGKITVVCNSIRFNKLLELFNQFKKLGLINFDSINGDLVEVTKGGSLYSIVMSNFTANKYRIITINNNSIMLYVDNTM